MASSTQDQRDESEEERGEDVGELPRLRPLPSRRVATDTPSPTSGMAGRGRTLPATPPIVDQPSSVADDANVNRPGGGDRFEEEFQHVADDGFPRRTADQLLPPSGPERGPPDAMNQLSAFRPIEAQATVLPIGEPSRLGWKERRQPQGALPLSLLPAETSQRSHTYPVSMLPEQPAEFIQPRREGYMSSYPTLPAAGSAPFVQSETTVGQPSLREGARIPALSQTCRRPPAVPAAAAPYDVVPAQLRSTIAQAPARMPEVSNGRSEDHIQGSYQPPVVVLPSVPSAGTTWATPANSVGDPGHQFEGREGPTAPYRHHYPVPPLPSFSGDGSVDDFVARFQNHAKHCGWTEEERLFHLRNSLQGVAAQVLWRLADTARSDDVLSRLKTRFGQPHQELRFRAELKARRRRPGESIQSLANDLYYLAERGYPKEHNDGAWSDILKDIFVTALCDPKLRMEVLMRQPKTMDEAADVATQIEAFQKVAQIDVAENTAIESAPRRRADQQVRVVQPPLPVTQLPSEDDATSILQRMETTLAGLDDRIQQGIQKALGTQPPPNVIARTPTVGAPAAYGSRREESKSNQQEQKHGGRRVQDRKPPRQKDTSCYNCGSTDGHWARDCPRKKKAGGQTRYTANQTKDVRRPSAVYAKATMYKRTVQVLFDSGCDRSVVHSRILPADLELRPTTEKLFTADNTELPLLGAAVINFTIKGVKFSADVVVSPAIEGLFLGVDWMKKNKAVMNFDDETIVVKGDSIRLHARPDAALLR